VLAIPGTSSLAHLEDNLLASQITVTASDLAEIDGLGE
jgi:aryl-alcohol dehydrogenase-like predicted oxidoreductase